MAMGPLISTAELAEHLDKNTPLLVLDTTWALSYEGPKSPAARYAEGHIPGAVPFDFRRASEANSPLHDTVCSAEQFQAYARTLGLTDEPVVCYSQGRFSGAARAFWLFRFFGHERVSILDGGMAQWRAEGRPISTQAATPAPGTFVAKQNSSLLYRVGDFERALQEKTLQIIDARPAPVASGERDFFAKLDSPASGRPGSIPGALNLSSGMVIQEDGRLLPLDELRAVVSSAGIDPSRPSVTSCSLGVGASAAAFVLYLLGNTDAAVFDGSWEAWSTR